MELYVAAQHNTDTGTSTGTHTHTVNPDANDGTIRPNTTCQV